MFIRKKYLKKNLFHQVNIPILMEDEVNELPDIYYVFSANFKEEIFKNNEHLIEKVEFFFPVNQRNFK